MNSPIYYFVASALASMRESRVRSTLAVFSVAIPLYVLGLFAIVGQNLGPWVESLEREAQVVVFVADAAGPAERAEIEAVLADPGVRSFDYVSPDEAFARLSSLLGDVLTDAPAIPALPASYEAHLTRAASATPERLLERLRHAPGVAEVVSQTDLLVRLSRLRALLRLLALVLGTILTATAMISVSNTIRLVFHARRDEVGILKLVGATDGFVRAPFLVEGAVLGGLAGLLATAGLATTYELLQLMLERAEGVMAEVAARMTLPPITLSAVVLGGTAIGLASAVLALRRLLRPEEG